MYYGFFQFIYFMFPYEKLEVYQKAFRLNEKIYILIKSNKNIPGYVKTQLGRASLSILLNIAEGSGRSTDKDRKNFLVNSRGSTLECSAIIRFLFKTNEISEDMESHLNKGFEDISRMLYVMISNIEKRLKA